MEVARARLAEEPDADGDRLAEELGADGDRLVEELGADVITIQYRINTRKQIAHAGFSLN
jgi:hypothetical protein